MSPLPLPSTVDNELLISPRIALDLLEGAPMADTFELVTAANQGTLDQLLEVRS